MAAGQNANVDFTESYRHLFKEECQESVLKNLQCVVVEKAKGITDFSH